ncbi:zinc ribbon domain-containing protein [bacterium]|nr:zinc ribbon domain-containing protein [bacterium]
MPLFEYQCESCGKRSEILLRSADQKPVCECGSTRMKKLLSAFAVSDGKTSSQTGCADGSCAMPSPCCSSGTCGLH